MALVTGQATVGTASTILFYVPAGPSVVTINSGTVSTATAYIGMGANVAGTASGYILDPGHTLTFAAYTTSAPGTVSAITTGSNAATLSWVISTSR